MSKVFILLVVLMDGPLYTIEFVGVENCRRASVALYKKDFVRHTDCFEKGTVFRKTKKR